MTGLELFIKMLEAKNKSHYTDFESLVINADEKQMADIIKICHLTKEYFQEQNETRVKFKDVLKNL